MAEERKYFENCKSLEDVRKTFIDVMVKEYAKSDNEQRKTFRKQYADAYKALCKTHTSYDKQVYEGEKAELTSSEYAKMVLSILDCKGVKIKVNGDWIWFSGNTKEHKDKLKQFGLLYSGKKEAWYYKPGCKAIAEKRKLAEAEKQKQEQAESEPVKEEAPKAIEQKDVSEKAA